jgi:hypothetical protein
LSTKPLSELVTIADNYFVDWHSSLFMRCQLHGVFSIAEEQLAKISDVQGYLA